MGFSKGGTHLPMNGMPSWRIEGSTEGIMGNLRTPVLTRGEMHVRHYGCLCYVQWTDMMSVFVEARRSKPLGKIDSQIAYGSKTFLESVGAELCYWQLWVRP